MAARAPKRPDLASVPRLTILVGKGGTGRSTVTAAMGLAAARRGLRVLMVEVASRQSIPGLFDRAGTGYDPVACADNLWCLRVTWEDALREYGMMKLKLRAAYELVFGNPFVRRLLPAIPGIAEIVVIGKVVYAATDGVPGLGRPDALLLDAPATGHGLSLLTAPMVIGETVASGPLAKDARHLSEVLLDPGFTRLHIVTTPEEMPVAEGVELYSALAVRRGFPFGPVIVNALQEAGLTPGQRDALSLLPGSGRAPPGVAAAARAALFMNARREAQRAHVERLRGQIPLPVVRLPDVVAEGSARARLERLAQHLDAALWREGR
jgi:anion-transporting  ArsA/GET3 family ATPase